MFDECSLIKAFDKVCSKLGTAMGLLMFPLRILQWTNQAAVSWHQMYEPSGSCINCRFPVL